MISVKKLYYVLLLGLLFCYMLSKYIYKTWYIAMLIMVIITLPLIFKRSLKAPGIIQQVFPLVLYFGYALLTSLWARYPNQPVTWVGIDSILILVFALFYILSMNCSLKDIRKFFVNIPFLAFLVTVLLYFWRPNEIRQGGLSTYPIAISLPFIFLEIKTRNSIKAIIAFVLGVSVLLISMQRTPLLISVISITLLVFLTSRNVVFLLRTSLYLLIVIVVGLALLWLIPISRKLMAMSFVRITGQSVVVDRLWIPAEPPDLMRKAINETAWELITKARPFLGIGYMNFMPWFGANTDHYEMNLHNIYQAWLLELGLPGFSLAAFMILRFFQTAFTQIKNRPEIEEKDYFKACITAMLSLLIAGCFTQVHQTPSFYIMLGIMYRFASPGLIKATSLKKTIFSEMRLARPILG